MVEKGVHSVDGNEFHLKVPVFKKEDDKRNDISPSISNSGNKTVLEIHGDIASLGKESLEMYLENTRRSGGGEIKELNLDANPPQVIFCDSEGAFCST